MNTSPLPAPSDVAAEPGVYRAGTLTYTKPALAILFFWLIWGDFCYTVMEAVTGPIMQLRFRSLNASNTEIGLILSFVPGIVYSTLNPIISFRSDRFRSRWGRRIPFIAFSLPFLVFFLIALGFGDRIGLWLFSHFGHLVKGLSANQAMILTLGALLVAFTFFNTFVTSTFWYLFNDVVPEHLLARFMSWFRVFGLASGAFYDFMILPHSATHATEIFLFAALLYLVGFSLMCFNVREGQYPPPRPYVGGRGGPIAAIKTYALGTHAFPHYWYLWLNTFIGGISGGTVTFMLFFYLAIGLTLKQYSVIEGTVLIVAGALTPAAGWLADRFHPIRVVMVGVMIGLFIITPVNLTWLLWHPAPSVVFWVVFALRVGLAAPNQALAGMWDPPMLMRLFPRTQFGQFCSTNGVWRMMGGIIGSGLVGVYLDVVGHWVGKERAYFYLPFWTLCFGLPGFYFLTRLYRSWKELGGDKGYVAPVYRAGDELTPDEEAALAVAGSELGAEGPLTVPKG